MSSSEERFFDKVKYSQGCWEWLAYTDKNGYGHFRYNRKMWLAHRWSYQFFKGAIHDGLFICHHCDNPTCVNPFHLFSGTNSDNIRDCAEKLRHRDTKKTHCPRGHEYSFENTRVFKQAGYGYGRTCIKCNNKHSLDHYYNKRKHAKAL